MGLGGEHFVQEIYHGPITRFLYSTIMIRIEFEEHVTTNFGSRRKLDEERRKQILKFLLVGVSEVKIKVSQECSSNISQGRDVLND